MSHNLFLNMAPVKRKRVSKKNKKSWRKNVDIKDVDNFLEDKRLEERLGFKYAEQKDEDLFQIDTAGDKGEKDGTEPKIKVPSSKQNVQYAVHSMRLVETDVPRCHEALINRSAVPPHVIIKTKKKKPEESITKQGRNILKQKLKNEIVKIQKRDAVRAKQKKVIPPKRVDFVYDVWSKENNEKDLNGCSEWLSEDTIRHTLSNTGQLKKRIPKTIISKTSKLPAVEAPHPGLSYNPSLKDHTDILQKVAEDEINVLNEEKHIDRVTTKMFNKMPQAKLQKQWLSEMTVGLTMDKESDEDDEEYKAVNPPVKNKKKTLKKRRKLKEALMLKEKLKQQKIEKRKISDIYKLRKFNEIIKKKEEKTLKNIEKRKKIKEKKPFTTKLLSQVKYKEPEMDFHLAEELSGNLRNVKPEGSILYDRFKSLQKRNILQPTLKRHVKKRKVKKYERAHTKMPWEIDEYKSGTKASKK